MSKESNKQFTLEEMKPEDFVTANEMRLQSFLDSYVNEDFGVTYDWILARNEWQRSPEQVTFRRQLMKDSKSAQWVAKNRTGLIIGVVGPYVSNGGVQRVGSLYVDKNWHGKGVGPALMQEVIDWHDSTKPIIVEVVSYNERAKAFYRKWDFEEIPGSESLFADKIPEIRMIRKAQI